MHDAAEPIPQDLREIKTPLDLFRRHHSNWVRRTSLKWNAALRSLWSSCVGLGRLTTTMTRWLLSASPSVNKGVRCRQDHRLALWARFLRRLFLLLQTLEVWPNRSKPAGEGLKLAEVFILWETWQQPGRVAFLFTRSCLACGNILFFNNKKKETHNVNNIHGNRTYI